MLCTHTTCLRDTKAGDHALDHAFGRGLKGLELHGAVGAQAGVMTASPEQVKEMMETVTNLQETVDQRKADMDAMAGLDDN